jgi:hypothetical protein
MGNEVRSREVAAPDRSRAAAWGGVDGSVSAADGPMAESVRGAVTARASIMRGTSSGWMRTPAHPSNPRAAASQGR